VKAAFLLVDRLLETLLFLVLAAMAAVVFANVVCRYGLNTSLSWGEEIALLLMVWLTYLGAALVMRDRAHYAFDYLLRSLPAGRRFFTVTGHLIVVGLTAALGWWAAQVTVQLWEWTMVSVKVSQGWVYAACPVGCLFMLLYAVRNFIEDLQAPAGGSGE
jgi:TRAP-type transport system small permease protein